MTKNERSLAALKLVRREIDNTAEALRFRLELGVDDDDPEVVELALKSFFGRGRQVVDGYILAFEKLVEGENG